MNKINISLILRQAEKGHSAFFKDFTEYNFTIYTDLKAKDLMKLLSIKAAICYDYPYNADVYYDGKCYCAIDLYPKLFKDEYIGLLRMCKDSFFALIEDNIKEALKNEYN